MAVANVLAFYDKATVATVAAVKYFIVQASEEHCSLSF
jgi:hypothetical protein